MKSFMLIAALLVGCSGDDDGDDDVPPGDQSHTPPPASDGTGTKPSNATDVTCSVADDCGYWFCRCEDGAVVNSANCTNGYCLNAAGACPDACAVFEHGPWTGEAGGGPVSGGGGGGGGDECGGQGSSDPACDSCFKDNCCDQGASCGANAECLSYWDCVVLCFDEDCRADCAASYPGGVGDYEDLESCLLGSCSESC